LNLKDKLKYLNCLKIIMEHSSNICELSDESNISDDLQECLKIEVIRFVI